MALLGEVRCLADDVVLAVLDAVDEGRDAVGLDGYCDAVTNSNWVGAAYALESEVAFYLAIKKLAVVRADNVPTSCILDNDACHYTVMISFSLAA